MSNVDTSTALGSFTAWGSDLESGKGQQPNSASVQLEGEDEQESRNAGDALASVVRRAGPQTNHGAKVVPLWDGDREGLRNQAAWRIQLCARAHVFHKKKLHRKNLQDRLYFESKLLHGFWRLFSQLMVFGLLLVAVSMSGDPLAKRGIYSNLRDSFALDLISGDMSRKLFVEEHLPAMAETAKKYFPLSTSEYFVRLQGERRLLEQMETFTVPKLLGGVTLAITVPEFTMTAIVRTSPYFDGGYILRKRMVPAGVGSELACWGWYMTRDREQELHYGCHDYYPTQRSPRAESGKQERIKVENATGTGFPEDEYRLLTMVVKGTNVTFWRNLEKLGTVAMERPVTDCFNNREGVLVGSSAMTLGQLSFYPKAMAESVIEEIFYGGGTLEDLSTGSSPRKVETTELEDISAFLQASSLRLEERVAEVELASATHVVLQDTGDSLIPQKPPSHPLGRIPFNTSLQPDNLTMREYYSLLYGPWLLDKAPVEADGAGAFAGERYWHSDDFPSFAGRGVSFTTWIRNVRCHERASCGTFLLSAHRSTRSAVRCWSAWLETDGIFWDALGGNPDYGYVVNKEFSNYYTDSFKVRNDVWRHVAFVFNEENDKIEFYLDGALVFSKYYGKSVRSMYCGPVNVSTGFRWPEYTNGEEIELFDLRMYPGAPLTSTQVSDIAQAKVPDGSLSGNISRERCQHISSPDMKDSSWTDRYGHGCTWYYSRKQTHPNVCDYPGLEEHCPIACDSKQQCFNKKTYKRYFAWNSIRRIERQSRNGTVCLASNTNATAIFEACKAWLPSINTDTKVWQWKLDVAARPAGASRVNLTECQSLLRSIDNFCEFDHSEVSQFTDEVRSNGGDFTLGFWVRPIGPESLTSEGKFQPSVHFLNSVSPPFSNLAFAPFESSKKGEVRMRSGCTGVYQDSIVNSEGVEFRGSASLTDWSFMSVVKNNKARLTGNASASVLLDSMLSQESQGDWDMCVGEGGQPLFTAIEVNYPMLISPIMMVPEALPIGLMQQSFYEEQATLVQRPGPAETNSQRVNTKVEVVKEDYVEKSVLMATPIIFQKRVVPSENCSYEYSTEFLSSTHDKVWQKCRNPFQCPVEALDQISSTIACRGESTDKNGVFGLVPQEFSGTGYADFLFTITDTEIVFREGELLATSDFFDSHTQTIKVIFVFYTPDYGMTTVLTVEADMGGATSVSVKFGVQHYSIMEGYELTMYLVVLFFVVTFLVLMAYGVVRDIQRYLRDHFTKKREPKKYAWLATAIDIFAILATLIIVSLRIPAKFGSAEDVAGILRNLSEIEWTSSELSLFQKKDTFFTHLREILALIEAEEGVNAFLNVVLIVFLFRVIQSTSLHPRLALFTGTVSQAIDDFWHSFLLIMLIMGSFAGIGTWRFGAEKPAFSTWEKTMQTQFMMMLGEFGSIDDWGDSIELSSFVVLYLLVMFLIVLNFLLAIIVEAYMGIRRDNDLLEIECEFFTDMYYLWTATITRLRHKWPAPMRVSKLVRDQPQRQNYGFMDLWNTGVFPDQKAVATFMDYYSGFDFLEPVAITSFGMNRKQDEHMKHVFEIEKRIANLLGKRLPTLQEQAQMGTQAVLPAKGKKVSTVKPISMRTRKGKSLKNSSGSGSGGHTPLSARSEGSGDILEGADLHAASAAAAVVFQQHLISQVHQNVSQVVSQAHQTVRRKDSYSSDQAEVAAVSIPPTVAEVSTEGEGGDARKPSTSSLRPLPPPPQ
uniref:Polycystin cation channel PKD1/PKD2 domain-containing protein n=1 Tax=Hemiselmis tepida TaxID=464990 RepID=A0A7S0VMJ9_9CRYP|mmetsp:Transcript_21603/g.54517  ORF Transcript_21603/g.54517 Transcript_21603/m.54517 type:complete len:1722 (+) Transcript_21603:62-5227(+)|eukprot:CAMPEP_0174917698 /NCGR_PEP_ID=MMETSP1355-20121228/2620_1 /TAXON_ID=464990 /ORGANISM="Hemiselmis tepida, Strain CCMP443" /LENGTH=1721 /DNA_ID=CAMNT_0016162821 /DNA_START=62 /DNA_END=5227 /DNA_ORIENTATION=+